MEIKIKDQQSLTVSVLSNEAVDLLGSAAIAFSEVGETLNVLVDFNAELDDLKKNLLEAAQWA